MNTVIRTKDGEKMQVGNRYFFCVETPEADGPVQRVGWIERELVGYFEHAGEAPNIVERVIILRKTETEMNAGEGGSPESLLLFENLDQLPAYASLHRLLVDARECVVHEKAEAVAEEVKRDEYGNR